MRELKIGKHTIQITHEDKILFPKSKITKSPYAKASEDMGAITKGELINYYIKISPVMIPHVKNRPIMMHRFIHSIEEEGFYQKNISDYFPEWIERAKVEKMDGSEIEQVLCNNPETLVYITNQLCITPHIWLSKVDKINYPDKLVFDLDPAGPKPEESFALVIKAAKIIKSFLENLGLTPFVMTTGSKGLHVVVPIKRENKFEYVKKFAHDCAIILEKENPKIFTNEMRKEKRNNKIFLDIYRNSYAQTSVAPYAVRAIEGAPVATPIEWSEVNKNLNAQKYNIKNIFMRLEKKGDAWENFGKYACSLRGAKTLLRQGYGEHENKQKKQT